VHHLELADVAEKGFAVLSAMVSFVERHCAPIADRICFKVRNSIGNAIVLKGHGNSPALSFDCKPPAGRTAGSKASLA
jgi:hypothetical protein